MHTSSEIKVMSATDRPKHTRQVTFVYAVVRQKSKCDRKVTAVKAYRSSNYYSSVTQETNRFNAKEELNAWSRTTMVGPTASPTKQNHAEQPRHHTMMLARVELPELCDEQQQLKQQLPSSV